jgi:hypothetical protein
MKTRGRLQFWSLNQGSWKDSTLEDLDVFISAWLRGVLAQPYYRWLEKGVVVNLPSYQ